jgi:DNA-binding transcriptional LysR family regulator
MEASIRLSGIDLNLLLTLAMLLQTRSVSATARKLGASQPTASRALARLRELFDDPLLIRTNHGMELTRRAEELVDPLQSWLADTKSLFVEKEFTPAEIDRRFRIAATDFGVSTVLLPMLARLQKEAPGASFDIVAYSDTMFTRLASGELDLIVTGLEPDFSTLYGKHLFKDPHACIMRADHPALAAAVDGRLTLDEFMRWPHINLVVGESDFDRVGTFLGDRLDERRVIATMPYFNTAPLAVSDTDAIMTLARRTAEIWKDYPNLAVIEPPREFQPFEYWVLYPERSRRDPATLWLVDVMAESCAD